MARYPIIRTVYLYLFALVGLTLLIIGSVRFLDMGLRAFIFTKAEEEQRQFYKTPPIVMSVEEIERLRKEGEKSEGLTASEKAQLDQLISDYKMWQENIEQIDPITARRHRDASINLSMILIGLPLYLYHWSAIKRETKKESQNG